MECLNACQTKSKKKMRIKLNNAAGKWKNLLKSTIINHEKIRWCGNARDYILVCENKWSKQTLTKTKVLKSFSMLLGLNFNSNLATLFHIKLNFIFNMWLNNFLETGCWFRHFFIFMSLKQFIIFVINLNKYTLNILVGL